MKSLAVVSILILATGAAWAEKYGITSKTLANGLDVIVIENHSVPWSPSRSLQERRLHRDTGPRWIVSSVRAHVLQGQPYYPDQESYMERQRELGMVWNGTTSEERVNYFFTLHKDDLAPAWCYARRHPLSAVQAGRARARTARGAGEFDRNEASPFFHWMRAVSRLSFSKYYSRKNVIGDREIIATATQEKMRTIQNRYYIPNNSALFVAGDVQPEAVFAQAEELYGDWPRGADPFVEFPIPEHPPLDSNMTVTVIQPVNAVMIMKQWHGQPQERHQEHIRRRRVLLHHQPAQLAIPENAGGFRTGGRGGLGYQTLVHTGPSR